MLPTVDLHNKLPLQTNKIDYVRTYFVLALKLAIRQAAISNMMPDSFFGFSLIAA